MQQQVLMSIELNQLRDLHEKKSETGMNFQIVKHHQGLVAIMEDGTALPCYDDPIHYDVEDLISGKPIPTFRRTAQLSISLVFRNRVDALTALRAASISSKYTGGAGAFPLIASDVLAVDTTFYRCLSSPKDHRYIAGKLKAGTYLTTLLDQSYANSGFATVGRYALPIPLPASNIIQYELKKGTTIKIGTVAPMFGQAGGGVEVQLPKSTPAKRVGAFTIADY